MRRTPCAVFAVLAAGGVLAASAAADPLFASAAGQPPVRHRPLTNAQCKRRHHVRCYGVSQIRRAYGMPALYRAGDTGRDDVSHENAIEQNETVNEILEELKAADKPRVTALNKADLVDDPADIDVSLYPNAVPVSALKRQGLDTLLETIARVVAEDMVEVDIIIPYRKGDLVELFHRRGNITQEEHLEEGVHIVGRIHRTLRGYFLSYSIAE